MVGAMTELYGLTWPGKRAAQLAAQSPARGQLALDRKASSLARSTQNLLIEGDNLEVLKLLLPTHRGQVKLIYIDPPYNTGQRCLWSDSHRESRRRRAPSEPDGDRHAGWLSLMWPRLALARQLLRPDGVMFVSIDDHEVHHLRLLLEEIYGAENFLSTIVWQKMFSSKNSARHFSLDHEYVLAIARDAERWRPRLLPRTAAMQARYRNPDRDPRGVWTSSDLCARNYYGAGTYSVTCPSGRVIAGPPVGTYWRIAREKLHQLDQDRRIWWGPSGNNMPRLKRFLSEVKAGAVPRTLWTHQEVGHTQEAKRELIQRVDFASSDDVFDTPKPCRLVERVVELGTEPDEGAWVLDCFAGSGTTGEAVMRKNLGDGGNRRFILVELGREIHRIARERLRSAARALGGSSAVPPVDLGWRVLRLRP
jgi:adenine-specific DNA-methyltransferase